MKKNIRVLVLLIVLSLCLAACGEPQTVSPQTTAEDTQATTEPEKVTEEPAERVSTPETEPETIVDDPAEGIIIPETEPESTVPVIEKNVSEIRIGQTIRTDKWEITLTRAEFTDAIYPEEMSDGGIYYEQAEGKKFCNLEFDIKNLSPETLAFYDAVNSVVVHCGDYSYNGYYMFYDMGGRMSITMLQGTTHGPAPLDVTHLYVETDIPNEAAEIGSTMVELVIAGEEYVIKF